MIVDVNVGQLAREVECSRSTMARAIRRRLGHPFMVRLGRKRDPESAAQRRPWESEGVSRATWYRRKTRQIDTSSLTGKGAASR